MDRIILRKYKLMYQKLVLLFVSFMLFACAGTSMQGKGFGEFPQAATNDAIIGYGITWTQCTGALYRLSFDNSSMDCPAGAVAVMVVRNQYTEADAELMSAAGFAMSTGDMYKKLIGNTAYTSQNARHLDSYEYIIKKPTLSWAELTERVTALIKSELLLTKAAIAVTESADGDFVELETLLAELEKLGLIEDTSIRQDLSQIVAIGSFDASVLTDGRRVMGIAIINASRF
jgi:hypothetical protein